MSDVELGFLALGRGHCQEAVNIFKRALDRKKGARAYVGFGIAHERLGDLPTARWAGAKAQELSPTDKDAERLLSLPLTGEALPPAPARASRFRATGSFLEVNDRGWKRFFIKGMNLGLGLPGYFPGEYAIKEETYFTWFGQMSELGINAVRIYTIHPPGFYRALHRFNTSGRRLYLFQGIWSESPADGNFDDQQYRAGVEEEIRNAVDAVCGSAVLPERPGRAHGKYAYDVSAWLAAFLIGSEWEACAVKAYNEQHGRRMGAYSGRFLHVASGAPFERWIASVCDFLQTYEHRQYGMTHPVAAVSWPTLDPLVHPSESGFADQKRLQGIEPGAHDEQCIGVHVEDLETLDCARISVREGAGFFALYHVYPYYPDFMNNDYETAENTCQAYLRALKDHHAGQPVLIAEFGVPGSRESAHWHRGGWNHGGHSDRRQGEINGLLMRTIRETGMAGGILFSWFDEWFKKTWLFHPYERPAERKPLWFNLQDPEENYGLLAAYPSYPGKTVSLAGKTEEWKNSEVVYARGTAAPVFRFNDGFDDSRTLLRLLAQHDEGFLYLRLETAGAVDFTKAGYLIGLSTCGTAHGERLLPFGTNTQSPVGLQFVIQLAGKTKSRILAARSYDKFLNAARGTIRPEDSDEGAWVIMQNQTNIRRVSRDGKRFYPSRVSSMSALTFGSLDENRSDHHSLSDFFVDSGAIELRIPWGLVNVTDPSSRTVLWMDKDGATRTTAGIGLVAVSYKPAAIGLIAQATGRGANHTDSLPHRLDSSAVRTYAWEGWETPVFHLRRKKSYYSYKKMLATIPELI